MTDRPIIFSAPMVRALLDGRKTQTRRLLSPNNMRLWTGGLDHAGSYAKLAKDDFAQMMEKAREFRVIEGHHLQWQAINRFTGDYAPFQGIVSYAPGDRLYVRESAAIRYSSWHHVDGHQFTIDYAANYDGNGSYRNDVPGIGMGVRKGEPPKHFPSRSHNADQSLRWCPSIHMPRWASRLTLLVDDVRVERLQAISEADAIVEGAKEVPVGAPPGIPDLVGYHHGQKIEQPEDCFISASASFRHLWKSLHGAESWDANPWVVAVSFRVARGNIDRLGQAA